MYRLSVLLSLAVLQALASPFTAPHPHVSLPFALQFGSLKTNLVEHDRSRAMAFKASAQSGSVRRRSTFDTADVSINVTNQFVTYTADVGVGSPPTTYTLLIDTGSSNTWVGATQPFVQTSTSTDTGQNVSVTYGSGFFSGEEFIDTVTLSPNLVIENQSIGVASQSQGFTGLDGILGIGPISLTVGTVGGPNSPETVPTVTDNLFAQGSIAEKIVGISFNPIDDSSENPETNGELTFGQVDTTKFTGDITFVPVTSTSPSSLFFGIDQSITYGTSGRNILSSTAGIVDTGTTLVLLSSDAFTNYARATGGTNDFITGLLRFSNSQFERVESLFFHIGPTTFELTPNAQIWPRALNSLIGGRPRNAYSIVNSLGTPSGEGFDFVNGFAFLERFYSVFDSGNSQVGFATTPHTDDTTN